jgi:hypothetical protein
MYMLEVSFLKNSALGKVFRLGAMLNPLYDTSVLNFASILSTENNRNNYFKHSTVQFLATVLQLVGPFQ